METSTYSVDPSLPPQSRESEDAVIGSILINPAAFEEVEYLTAADFYIVRNGWIWSAFEKLHKTESRIDILTVSVELDKMGWLDEVGGVAYLSVLVNNIPSTLHIEAYAKIIKDKARRRNLLEQANSLARMAYDERSDISVAVDAVLDNITATASTKQDGAVHISAFTGQLVQEVDIRRENPDAIWGIRTGFYDFDNATGGMQDGELMILAGDSGVGKSMLAGQMAIQLAQGGWPGAYYSLEMTGTAVARRMVSGASKINTRKIKTGMLSDIEYGQFIDHIGQISGLPLFMSDASDWTIQQLRSDLVKLKRKYGIRWFILDYLLLMDALTDDEIAATTIVSKGLKKICRSLGISGIAVHSLNKLGMDNNKPVKSNLRGSGQVVFNADLICIMTKDECKPEFRKLTFSKGRELEVDMFYFNLIKKDTFPFFQNAVTKSVDLSQL
jgi:replicative DNA helicase